MNVNNKNILFFMFYLLRFYKNQMLICSFVFVGTGVLDGP